MKHLTSLLTVLFAVLLCGQPVRAITVRVASFNVKDGVGLVGSAEYNAVRDILQRVGADIVAFQELKTTDRSNWETLVHSLGYSNTTFGAYTRLSGNIYVGYASRFPVLSTEDVFSPSPAYEMTRPPHRAVIAVPGAEVPLVLWTVHQKASYGDVNEFRRSVESFRCVEDIDAYLAANPTHREYMVLGDFNDDVGQYQSVVFSSSITNDYFPASYQLGGDITFPVPYSVFPRDAYEISPTGMTMLDPTREDSTDGHTYASQSSSYTARYDYLFASTALYDSPQGAPRSEVYDTAYDDGVGGLPKYGAPPAAGTSTTASDHYLLFADIHMTDVVIRLDLAGADASGVTLQFPASSNHVYTLEYHDDLSISNGWSQVTDFISVPGVEGPMQYLDDGTGTGTPPAAEDGRWYRLKIALP